MKDQEYVKVRLNLKNNETEIKCIHSVRKYKRHYDDLSKAEKQIINNILDDMDMMKNIEITVPCEYCTMNLIDRVKYLIGDTSVKVQVESLKNKYSNSKYRKMRS